MTARQVLKKLIKEINVNNLVQNWDNFAENSDNEPVLATDPTACRWCISGHIAHHWFQLSPKERMRLNRVRSGSKINLLTKHTPNQVKVIFTRWLKKLEA